MKRYYCWRCECVIPMLDEHEWERIVPALSKQMETIKEIRKQRNCDIATAQQAAGQEPSDLYFEMTGYRETNPSAIWHHRLAKLGPECQKCGHLLRTPKARLCANCGLRRKQ